MKKLKITGNEWRFRDQGDFLALDTHHPDGTFNVLFTSDIITDEERDNIKLIADAGTTYNKCGLTPSELLKQKDVLLDVLKKIVKDSERQRSEFPNDKITNLVVGDFMRLAKKTIKSVS